ncbi:MAG: ribonucleotide reductase N-terminal alpha domain-containing protein, partial [Candidatus Woesebacteria bacterium]|nr:ribonucleotide reductase N-terminal alpha domain-containing protein [Candidatus Woesebacteria bacterium]
MVKLKNKKIKKQISFESFKAPTYEKIKTLINKKIGARPSIPNDLAKGDWTEQALKVLEERYLIKDNDLKPIETPEDMLWRVSWEIASSEARWGATKKDVEKIARDFYGLMVSRKFLPNSPTLMNAGTNNGLQYSACFVLPIEDSMEGIFDALKYQAIIHKTGGGTGFAFSRLRQNGSIVKTSSGTASGPISFMRIFDAATNEVKQGGKRRGANMGILRVDHPDVLEFIHCKEEGGITNFNISIALTDAFMKAYQNGENYDLISPKNKEVVGSLSAKLVFDEIADGAWRTGDPGLIFIEKINCSTANPVPSIGAIEATNPCVVGETLVSTKMGLLRIKDIVEHGNKGLIFDNRVVDMSKNGVSISEAVKLYNLGLKKVVKLITKSGYEITATPDHRIMSVNGWSEIKSLKNGDKILIQSAKGQFNEIQELPFKTINNFPLTWSKELGQVLGLLIGDGWLRFGDKNCRVGFTFGEKDKDLLFYFKNILNEWYGKDIKEVKRPRNTYHLSYHSKSMVNLFMKFGVKAVKAENKVVPESVFSATKEAVIGFLQGLFSADGTVRDSRKSNSDWIALTSKSERLLKDVQILLLNLGIKSRIFDRGRPERKGMFPYKTKDGVLKAYILDGKLYELGVFGDFREKFKNEIGFLNVNKQTHLENTRPRKNKRLLDPFIDEVVEIKDAGVQNVYDVTEPVSHSIIANGIVVHQCGEQPLYPFDACNLGSIFLTYFVKDGEIDWDELKKVTRTSVRFLDNVIEVNPYPLEQIRKTVFAIRRIGLGIGGWADMLLELGIPYDSDEAILLAEKIMKTIQDEAVEENEKLAKVRGAFPLFDNSIYKSGKPRRNSTVTTIAPTGTISIIAGASSGIEPLFAIAYQHIVKDKHLDRKMTFVNPKFEEVSRKEGFWSKELMDKVGELGVIRDINEVPQKIKDIFGTAHEINPEWHIKTQAIFQKYTENAVSKTINLKSDATVDDVKKVYLDAWNAECKGITVFRDGCKDTQVLNLGVNSQKKEIEKEEEKFEEPLRHRPYVVRGSTYRLSTPVGTAFITINEDE